MKVSAVILAFLISFCCFSQITEKERLLSKIDSVKDYKDQVQLFADLAWEYIITENDSALIYANEALKISTKNNYPLGQAIAFESKGLYHELVTGNYDEASSFYFKGIYVCEENGLNYASSIYHSLGVMFHTSDNYDKALEYYTNSYNLAIKANDSVLIKKCLINLGSVNSSLEHLDKAVFYMEKSFDYNVRRELDYTTYSNLGYLYTKQEKYNKALPYLLKSIEQNSDNPNSEINLYLLLHLKAVSKDTLSIPILNRAKLALKNVVGPRNKSLFLRNLADYYKSIGDYQQALEYRDQYITVFEKIKENQRDDIVHQLETQYETEKKDTQLKYLKVEGEKNKKQKQLYLVLSLAGICIALLLGVFSFKNRLKNKKLATQKMLLETALGEKNLLLKEIHHRVKNSFQMVSSLLYLQSENADDNEAKIAIKEAENRVRSMILIHQKLYNKDELVGINVQEYVHDLTHDIIESHVSNPSLLQVQLNIVPLILNIETITPFGLILNELITNVIKHAYSDINDNILKIDLKKENNQLVLQVVDNGTGLSTQTTDTSFGITLMKALSKKLKATLDIKPRKDSQGTIATLIINRFQVVS
ncbi:tetratricopeptide repeat-containing sensor histidine kinase [Psychroserpens sp. MEBiC05023]